MSELQKFIKKQTAKLSGISCRKIYGLDAFYLQDKPFIVISSDEHIVVKVDDYEVKKKIQEKSQGAPWVLNDKVMENWFILPETFNKKKSKIAPVLEMTSKVLLQPRKEKKKRTKKNKVSKELNEAPLVTDKDQTPSIWKKLFRF